MRLLLAAAAISATLATAAAAQSTATAPLLTADGSPHGTVTFQQAPGGVVITVAADGLAPGPHGFHIHETGACTPDFKAAGGHFAPDGREHGFLARQTPHAGDLPNLIVDADGTGSAEYFSTSLSFDETAPGYLFDGDGSAVMVHADADDYMDMDSAGDRLACGVIERG